MQAPVPYPVPGGQFAIAATTLFTVPSQSPMTVQITLVNVNALARTFNLYLTRAGASASQRLAPKDCSLASNAMYETNILSVFPGDSISQDCSAEVSIDYTISAFQYL